MSDEDIRPVFWLVTDIGVLMGRANSHDRLLAQLYPHFDWSYGNSPWRHKFASGEIETTNALAELIGDDELESKGDIYMKMVFDFKPDLGELAAAVAAEARRQGIYLSGKYTHHGNTYLLEEAEAAIAADDRPDFVERWRQYERELGNL